MLHSPRRRKILMKYMFLVIAWFPSTPNLNPLINRTPKRNLSMRLKIMLKKMLFLLLSRALYLKKSCPRENSGLIPLQVPRHLFFLQESVGRRWNPSVRASAREEKAVRKKLKRFKKTLQKLCLKDVKREVELKAQADKEWPKRLLKLLKVLKRPLCHHLKRKRRLKSLWRKMIIWLLMKFLACLPPRTRSVSLTWWKIKIHLSRSCCQWKTLSFPLC